MEAKQQRAEGSNEEEVDEVGSQARDPGPGIHNEMVVWSAII